MRKPHTDQFRSKQLETLAVFTHGVLGAFHALGLVYNIRRKNWKDIIMHGSALAYDVYATWDHATYRSEMETGS